MGRKRKSFQDKLVLQVLICAVILGVFYMAERMAFPVAEEVVEVFKNQMEKDYTVNEIVEGTATMGKAVVEKPVEIYGRLLEQTPTEEFIMPTDELTAAVFSSSLSALAGTGSVASGSGIGVSQGDGSSLEFFSDEEIQVYGAKGGVVSEIAKENDGTYTISIQHDNSLMSRYMGCTQVYVEALSRVKQGAMIASVNQGSRNRLVFEIWEKGEKVDPGKYLSIGQEA